MGSWRSFWSRRDVVVTLWRGSPIGVKLMMSSSAPPPRADRACTHLGFYSLHVAWNIVAAKGLSVDGLLSHLLPWFWGRALLQRLRKDSRFVSGYAFRHSVGAG